MKYLEIFLVVTSGGTPGIWWREVRDAADNPTMNRIAPSRQRTISHLPSPKLIASWKKEIGFATDGKAGKGKVLFFMREQALGKRDKGRGRERES